MPEADEVSGAAGAGEVSRTARGGIVPAKGAAPGAGTRINVSPGSSLPIRPSPVSGRVLWQSAKGGTGPHRSGHSTRRAGAMAMRVLADLVAVAWLFTVCSHPHPDISCDPLQSIETVAQDSL